MALAKKITRKPKPEISDRILDMALALAAERGWRSIAMTDIAAAAKAPLAEVLLTFPSKGAVVNAIFKRTDARVLATAAAGETGDSTRDNLFNVLMQRFDTLQQDRQGISSIVSASLCDPLALLWYGPRLMSSMALMLETAGLSSSGSGSFFRAKGLAVVYVIAFRVWLLDDSPDMTKTMATLDGGLKRAETLAALCWGRRVDQAANA